jgi:hypothetical protein
MSLEPEIEEWRKAWSSDDAEKGNTDAREVIAAAARYQRRSQFTLGGNIAFAALLLGASLVIAKRAHSHEMILWAVFVWMTTLIAVFLAIEGWRRSRAENIEKVADYVALHRRRALVDQWKVRTGLGLLVVQILIASVWLTTDVLIVRTGWTRFGVAMIVLLTISGIWLYVFAQMWRRSKSILDSTGLDGQGDE